MEGENKKTIKYLMNQPATVHNYGKLAKSDRPRTHSSPTSILRKFPHSLRHDQKHQTKIKRNSSPVSVIISGISVNRERWDVNRKSWSFGDDLSDESGGRPSSVESGKVCDPDEEVPVKRKFSETSSVSSDCSQEDGDVWKLRANTVATDRKSVQDVNGGKESSESGESQSQRTQDSVLDETETTTTTTMAAAPVGPLRKFSVINNSLGECKNGTDGSRVYSVSEFSKKLQFPIHKSTPNLLCCSVSHPERISDRLRDDDSSTPCAGKLRSRHESNPNVCQMPLRGSDSLPHLDQRHRLLHSILPKINRTIAESPELSSSSNLRKTNLSKACIKSETHINSQNLYNQTIRRREPYFSVSNIFDVGVKGSESARSDDEGEGLGLIDGKRGGILVRSSKDAKDVKNRWSYKRTVELMPNLRNLIGRRSARCDSDVEDPSPAEASTPLMTSPFVKSDSCSSLNIPQIRYYNVSEKDLSKNAAVYALTSLIRTEGPFHQVEPLKPVNRLRVPPNGFSGSTSRMCSRCSSLLSMASSSRYSINTTGSVFVSCSPSTEKLPEPTILCKLCLMEVPVSMSLKIQCCECVFCKDCMRLYVEFEIQEGAYDISCPDAQCNKQGIVATDEVETLVTPRMMERYRRFRLNHEVDMDRNRTWCPRAGCETVCNICPREKCAPTSVHCPTCDSDFCSNCKNAWHRGLTCEENSKKLVKEGRADLMEPGIPFDSDSIKCCPMCSVPIEKDEGCAQMMCKRCKHVFCWYCLASLDDDFLLRHYDKGPCKNKLGHTRASVIWHRTQVIGIFAGLGLLLLVASPLLLLAAPCIVCCKCRVCSGTKLDAEDDLPEESGT